MKYYNKISSYLFYIIIVATFIVAALFSFGGSMPQALVPDVWNPRNIDYAFILVIAILVLALVVTLVAAIVRLSILFREDKVKIIKQTAGVLLLIILLVVCWILGKETNLEQDGLNVYYNTKGWLKISDMFIYSIGVLLCTTIISIVLSSIKRKFID